MKIISNSISLAAATYGEVCRQAVYYVLLGLFAFLLFAAQYLTLFNFSQQNQALREMAAASLPLWGFLAAIVLSGSLVTAEFESQAIITLLAKPIGRGTYLAGRYLGLLAALALGLLFLGLAIVGTLWTSEGLPALDRLGLIGADRLHPDVSVVEFTSAFLRTTALPIFQAGILALGQVAILAALTVGLSPFLSAVATAGVVCSAYLLGHLAPHLIRALDVSDSAWLTALSAFFYTVLPHLEDFRDASLDRGGLGSAGTLVLSAVYAALYAGALLTGAAAGFRNRDIG